MDIDVGARVIVEFSRQERLQTVFVGMVQPEFLILKTPMTPGVRDRFAEGLFLEFRYLNEGKIVSFGAEVLRYQAAPASLVFVSYPKDMSEYNLRKEERLECRFPTELILDDATVTGNVIDISSGGCRFVCKGLCFSKIPEKTAVKGTFSTLESQRRYEFTGVVMALQAAGGEQAVGVKFREADLPEGVRARLAEIEGAQGGDGATV